MNTGEPASCWRDPVATGSQRSSRQQGKSESGTSSGHHYQQNNNLNQGFRDETDGGDEGLMQYYDEEDPES